MPAFKLTKDLCVSNKINAEQIKIITDASKTDKLYVQLLSLLDAENAKEQIEVLKKASKEVTHLLKSYPDAKEKATQVLHFLVHLFFIATSKNPCRRVLVSFFQSLSADVQKEVVCPAIEDNLARIFEGFGGLDNMTNHLTFDHSHLLRHDVDTMSTLLDNFELGERCVQRVSLEAVAFLAKLHQYFLQMFGPHLSPVQQNQTMHHSLETVKLTNRICQRSSVTMETRLREEKCMEMFKTSAAMLLQTDMRILLKEEFLLDCKTTSSMNICLVLKYCGEENLAVCTLSRSAFEHVDWLKKSGDHNNQLSWLEQADFSQLSRRHLTSSAYLCLCYGFLSMVSMETMLQLNHGKCILLHLLLQEFLQLSKSCKDVGSKLLAAKSICFLTQRLRTFIQKETCTGLPQELLPRIRGGGDDLETILQFVWTSWEDTVDAIRFTVKDIFDNVISIHLSTTSSTGPVKDDQFLQSLTQSILNDVSWSCKGKYGTLAILVGHLGSARMLALHDGIAMEVLQQLQEQTLGCYASDLYEALFRSHLTELDMDAADGTAWCRHWVDPVIHMLCGQNKLVKKHVIEYILPKLLKTGHGTLLFMIETLTRKLSAGNQLLLSNKSEGEFRIKGNTSKIQSGSHLGALIICLRRARTLGQLHADISKSTREKKRSKNRSEQPNSSQKQNSDQSEEGTRYSDQSGKGPKDSDQSELSIGETEMWQGIVDVKLLRQALICRDEQVRLDAFALLCESQKTTELISGLEMTLIKEFIPQNLNNQNPAFRQHFLSHLKKFLSRMKESGCALKRQAAKSSSAGDQLIKYKELLVWMTGCLLISLYPGSVFAQRTTCLRALSLLLEIFGRSQGQGVEYSLVQEVGPNDIHALLHCLTDTFEDNKMEAAQLLIACSHSNLPYCHLSEDLSKKLLDIALGLSTSTRPQDCTTAAYLFRVLLYQPSIFTLLQGILLHSVAVSQSEAEPHSENEAASSQLQNEADMQRTGNDEAVSGNFIKDAFRKFVLNKAIVEKDRVLIQGLKNTDSDRQLLLLWLLLKSLEDQTQVAKSNLMVAAANRPLYPTLQCMRYCLAEVNFRAVSDASYWSEFLKRFVSLCFEVSEVVSPVVHNSSPEGNIPLDEMAEMGESTPSEVSRSQETVMLMPEYLVVCCWRSVKEVSLILGQLTSRVPALETEGNQLLGLNQILQIGDYFTVQLLESKHRGAFELAYAGFVMLTDMLWRSSVPDLHQLPGQWLASVMADIKSGDPESRLCATRRSAGVPFYVQALVTTEPASTGRVCFQQTMGELLNLALDKSVVLQEQCTAKVHALNILRAMFKDSRLKDDVAPYVADGLKVAILGFKSPFWNVRNSATLLMSAMMVRIFGVKRSKDETSFSRKNCQTGRTFFHKYPGLYQFLLDELSEATEHITSQLHPGLYPILMVLGRLFPSAMEGTDTSLNLAAFIPHVISCSSSPVLKTRVMASRALQPLVEKDHVTSVFSKLLGMLPSKTSAEMKQNSIHGILLQIRQLLLTVPRLPQNVKVRLDATLVDPWSLNMDLLVSRHNLCLLTRNEALHISMEILAQFGDNLAIRQSLVQTLQLEVQDFTWVYNPCTPGLAQFQLTVANLYVQIIDMAGVDGLVERKSCSELTSRVQNGEKSRNISRKYTEVQCWQTKEDVQGSGKDCVERSGEDKHGDMVEKMEEESDKFRNILEDSFVNLLTAEPYEVRQSVMSKLEGICERVNKQTGKGHWRSRSDDEGQDENEEEEARAETSDWHGCLVESEKLYAVLLEMVSMETREECQIQLFKLLKVHPLTSPTNTGTTLALEGLSHKLQALLYILDQLESQYLSEDVKASMVGFSGALFGSLQSVLSHEGEKTNQGEITIKIKSVSLRWINMLLDNCDGDGGSEVKLACADALYGVVQLCGKGDREFQLQVTRCVLDLLQQDDLDVRDAAADVVYLLAGNQSTVPAHPYVCMDQLLETFIQDTDCGDLAWQGRALLDIVGSSSKGQGQDEEERLFDRGEGNTYWDEISLIQAVDQAFVRLGRSAMKGSTASLFSKMVADRVFKLLIDLDHILGQTKSDIADVFISSSSYQQAMIVLYKTLTVIKYGVQYSNDIVCHEKCQAILTKIRETVNCIQLPRLLSETLNFQHDFE